MLIGRTMRIVMTLGSLMFALPVTCGQAGDGTYGGGVQPSPGGRVNPSEPGFVQGGGTR